MRPSSKKQASWSRTRARWTAAHLWAVVFAFLPLVATLTAVPTSGQSTVPEGAGMPCGTTSCCCASEEAPGDVLAPADECGCDVRPTPLRGSDTPVPPVLQPSARDLFDEARVLVEAPRLEPVRLTPPAVNRGGWLGLATARTGPMRVKSGALAGYLALLSIARQ